MRKAAKIQPADLFFRFQKEILKTVHNYYGEKAEADEFDSFLLCQIDKIGKDISKVEFDFENWYYQSYDEFDFLEGMLGCRQLYPLSYIGMYAGGDWEAGVYFIVYLDQDGETFRAYIPKEGNTWNYNTKRAIGNNEKEDLKFLAKFIKSDTLTTDDCDILWDKDKIRQDIRKRIEVVR